VDGVALGGAGEVKNLSDGLRWISRFLNAVAGISLTFMMLLTVADVLLRAGRHPIVGTFEISALCLGLVIAFGIPQVSLDRGHVYMEFLLVKLPAVGRKMMMAFTRFLCLILFALIGYNLLKVGAGFQASGEVTATIQLPIYPVAYGVAVCCFLECCVFLFDILRIWRGEYE
jgi:TRAP-type C4-dicarboxylate transport system permease small subunit